MSSPDSHVDLGAGLRTAMSRAYDVPTEIDNLEPVSAGASRDIWFFDARPSGLPTQQLILRRDPPSAPRPEQMRREAAVLRAAAETGAPVPEVVASGDGASDVGSPYVIMRRLAGESIPRKILREPQYAVARERMTRQLGEIAARIHQIAPESVPGIQSQSEFDTWVAEYGASGPPSPALEIALKWLEEHRPPAAGTTVVHGDFRLGNILVDDGGVSGVLDWELAHIGDPMLDLGWVATKAWRFGGAGQVAGVGSLEDLIGGYAAVAGWTPSIEAVRWWQIFGSLRWAVMCRRQANRHLSGSEQSLELAMIGRRFAENEYDLLLALGLTAPRELPDPLTEIATVDDPVFGQPTASQLLSAVSDDLAVSREYADRLRRGAIDVVHRELLLGDELRAAYADALGAVGYRDERELAADLRDGATAINDDVLAAVRLGVEARLTVWNPRHLASS
ncbi:phosphotransferase [Epidermidibacterium keratini]|uniref:Phosphotransferase n=1 Tax=Epidermidibacterium keratini TaxID=1891644 RepID=A0A7L4YL23_9ACTN|nr:phosphotransferase [Epidermidibacterium keratini]QHB99895.1 phosphotransferase [Epidermidibacterium keratini]